MSSTRSNASSSQAPPKSMEDGVALRILSRHASSRTSDESYFDSEEEDGEDAEPDLAIIAEVAKYFWFCFGSIKEDSEGVCILRTEFISLCISCIRAGGKSWNLEKVEEEAEQHFAEAIPQHLLAAKKMDFLMMTEALSNLAEQHCGQSSAEHKALWLALVGNRVLRMKMQPAADSEGAAECAAILDRPVTENVLLWSKKHRIGKHTAYGSWQDVSSVCDTLAMSELCQHISILQHHDVERDPSFEPISGGRKGLFGMEDSRTKRDPEENQAVQNAEDAEQEEEEGQAGRETQQAATEQPTATSKADEQYGEGTEEMRFDPPPIQQFVNKIVVTSPVVSPAPGREPQPEAPPPAEPPSPAAQRRHSPLPRRQVLLRKSLAGPRTLDHGNTWICTFTNRMHRARVPVHPLPQPRRACRPRSAPVDKPAVTEASAAVDGGDMASVDQRRRVEIWREAWEGGGEELEVLQQHSIHGPLPTGGHLRRFSRSSSARERSFDRDALEPQIVLLEPATLLPPSAALDPPALLRLPPEALRPRSGPRTLPPRPRSCDPCDGRRPWLLPTRVRFGYGGEHPPLPPPPLAVPLQPLAHDAAAHLLHPATARRPLRPATTTSVRSDAMTVSRTAGDAPRATVTGAAAPAAGRRQLSAPPATPSRPSTALRVRERRRRGGAREKLQEQLQLWTKMKIALAEAEDGGIIRRRSSFMEAVQWQSIHGTGSQLY